MIAAALELRRAVDQLDFSSRVPWVYNPLHYAWQAHQQYLERYAQATCRVIFLGMNPGPWGMAQCGIPFGEVERVKNWLHIDAPIDRPQPEHPKRPVAGLDCPKSEVSGKRLWGLMSERFASAQEFSQQHFVANYCPLVFMEQSARNITPDTLPAQLRQPLEVVCDRHLAQIIGTLNPEWVVGVGSFAEKRAQHVIQGEGLAGIQVGRILHPSPASPAANKGWSAIVTRQLRELGVW
jgi:single-strand selective monofunctional uracil DNA glycosylase